MDPATIIGVVIAFGALLGMMTVEGAKVSSLLLLGPMMLVFGGTIGVGIASGTIPDAIAAVKSLPRAFKGVKFKPQVIIDQLVELADVARRQGLLALEQEANKINDPFLKSALQGVADGLDAEDLAIMLEDKSATQERVLRTSAKFYTSMGGYAPTIGIIGTVVSLTHVLENLSDPGSLGKSIAAAFVATLWGVLSANFLWLPIGTRLIRLAELDVQRMTILIEGVLAIQAGSQPRTLGERLRALVPQNANKAPKVDKGESLAKAA